MSGKNSSNVSVGVRIRPLNAREIESQMPVSFTPNEDCSQIQEYNDTGVVVKTWAYDHVFGPETTNEEIFDTLGSNLVEFALEGYNTVLFMYGQTSSGKTFTLFGGGNKVGLVQRSMETVQQRIKSSSDMEFVLKMTYAELYNEELKDLLAVTPNENLKIVDDPNLGPLIQNITEVTFTTAADMKRHLDEGENRRHFGVTNMNAHSSRSHVLVRLSIESRKVPFKPANPLRQSWGKDKPTMVSSFNLVDLAGSERANKSGTSGISLKEGSYINKSLLTLGTVISNLSEGKTQHIPYRNSKLTRLLASALGGNAKTCMITCISPSAENVLESLSTLRFASRAKRIVNVVRKNEIMNAKSLATKLALQNTEIEMLRSKLELSRQMGFVVNDDDAQKGEITLEKAKEARKSWRNLRFLVTQTPKLVRALKHGGLMNHAKKVQTDLKLAIAGHKDLVEVVEEQSLLLNSHLPSEQKLIDRINILTEENDADVVLTEDGDDGSLFDCSEADLDDNFFMLDSEEFLEKLETARMETEEVRSFFGDFITQLSRDLQASQMNEKDQKKQLEKLKSVMKSKEEKIDKLSISETNLLKQSEDIKDDIEREKEIANEKIQSLMNRVSELEVLLGDMETESAIKNHEHLVKDVELEKLKTQKEQLSRELQTALASRKSFEVEMKRARADLKMQMERLRNNMHEMLLQGGEESKVIESHNIELQKELDLVRDKFIMVTSVKENLEIEISHLRSEIATIRDEQQSQIEEIYVSLNETSELSQKLRQARLDNARLQSAINVTEQDNKRLQQQLTEISINKDELLELKSQEFKQIIEKLNSDLYELQGDFDRIKRELQESEDENQAKQLHHQKIENSLHSDVLRLEKKTSAQSKTIDELQSELTLAITNSKTQQIKSAEEVRALTAKALELQAVLDSINRHVEAQLNESSHAVEFNFNTADSRNLYAADYYDDDGSSTVTGSAIVSSRRNSLISEDAIASAMAYTPFSPSVGVAAGVSGLNFDYYHSNDPSPNKYSTQQLRIGVPTLDEKSELDSSNVKYNSYISPDYSSPVTEFHDFDEGENRELWEDWSNFDMGDRDLDKPSAQFLSLVHSLLVLKVSLEFSMRDERNLRKMMEVLNKSEMDKNMEKNEIIDRLKDNENCLRENQEIVEKSLHFMNEKEKQYEERIKNYEDTLNNLRSESNEKNTKSQAAIGNAQKYEQNYYDLKIKHEKMKNEFKMLIDLKSELTLSNLTITTKLEVLEEENSVLQSRIDLLNQELGIITAERDELHKQLFNPYKSSFIKETPTELEIKTSADESDNNSVISSVESVVEVLNNDSPLNRTSSGRLNDLSSIYLRTYSTINAKF